MQLIGITGSKEGTSVLLFSPTKLPLRLGNAEGYGLHGALTKNTVRAA
jgi:hypothetical protein